MKNLKRSKWLLMVLLCTILITSCNKETDQQIIDNISLCRNACLVTHTEDNGLDYSVNIYYNKFRNPDLIQFYENTTAIEYDKIERLSRIRFSTVRDHEDFVYKGELLPTKMNYYVPNYTDYGMTDSLNATLSFKYNYKGQIVQLTEVNLWYPGYDFSLNYTYSSDGNLKTIINVPESGSSFTQFAATRYDNKPNLMGDNPWLKYILLLTGFEPYQYLMYSKNNAVDWSEGYSSYPTDYFTSTFEYNSRGFANKVFLHNVDAQGNVLGDYIRTSSSTCDENPYPPSTNLIKRSGFPFLNQFKPGKRLFQK